MYNNVADHWRLLAIAVIWKGVLDRDSEWLADLPSIYLWTALADVEVGILRELAAKQGW